MGITIHFKGQLKSPDTYDELLELAQTTASAKAWSVEPIASDHVTLLRVTDDEQDWNYEGPVKGAVLHVHPDAEPLRLEFDQDLYIQEYVKTQFAGPAAHIAIIDLLRQIEPLFLDFRVDDEGEYWETEDESVLEEHIVNCRDLIEDLRAQHPNSSVMVRKSDGRIIDLIKRD